MKRKAAKGLAAAGRISSAANEEFTTTAGVDSLAERPQAGWNPYEVWRTRVKESSESSSVTPKSEPDPFH
jgi:hypothetical protein